MDETTLRERREAAATEIENCEQQLAIGRNTPEQEREIRDRMARMRLLVFAYDLDLEEYGG